MNKKDIIKIIIVIIALSIILIILNITNSYIKKEKEQIENSTHSIIIKEQANIYKKPNDKSKIIITPEKGSDVYLLDEYSTEEGDIWYKAKCEDKKGYIKKEDIEYYKKSNEQFVLMSDVSHFNIQFSTIKNKKDYQRFLIQNDIQYVYIRSGGRGYGKEGNFYEDKEFQTFVDACEYLKIPYGFYFVDEAINNEEIEEEALWIKDFMNKNAGENCTLPIAIDIEKHEDVEARTDDIWNKRGELVKELIQSLKEKNIESIVYSNVNTANKYLANIDTNFWVAYYTKNGELPSSWYTETNQEPAKNEELMKKVIAWQFTETGLESKIEEKVDLSIVKNY